MVDVKQTKLIINIDKELKEKLKVKAKKENRTVNGCVRNILTKLCEENQSK